jgi:transcriptional regulator with XRE-family HTH domain
VVTGVRAVAARSGCEWRAFSTYQLAEALGWSQTKVSKIERGQSPADPDDVALWATAVNASKAEAAELVALASVVADQMRQWRDIHGRGLAARQRELAATHAAMTGYLEFAPYAVPGFLQTEPYAARVLELADVARRGGTGDAVAERIARQAVLLNPSRSFRFVVTEAAMRIGFGSEEIMHDQGAKILATMSLPNVSMAVLPVGAQAPALMSSGFVIYDLPGGADGAGGVAEPRDPVAGHMGRPGPPGRVRPAGGGSRHGRRCGSADKDGHDRLSSLSFRYFLI